MTGKLQYTVSLRPEPEGGFTVLVPALPEIVSFGENEAHAMEMAKEAIEVALEIRREQGETLPQNSVITGRRPGDPSGPSTRHGACGRMSARTGCPGRSTSRTDRPSPG